MTDGKSIGCTQYIMDEYKKMTGETIDEMKLHKLLYFSQRECLALTNKPLFEEQLEGWKYGRCVGMCEVHIRQMG